MSCEEFEEKAAEQAAYDSQYDEQQEREYQNRRYEAAEAADDWADTYLAAEKAVAVFWRDAFVHRDTMNGKRTGRLGTPEGQIPSYACDPNYEDAQSGGCVPADRDYDCWELRSWGIVNIPILNYPYPTLPSHIGDDWMLLDDDHDGMGCEVEPVNDGAAVQTAQAVTPSPESPDQCDGVVGMLGCLLGR